MNLSTIYKSVLCGTLLFSANTYAWIACQAVCDYQCTAPSFTSGAISYSASIDAITAHLSETVPKIETKTASIQTEMASTASLAASSATTLAALINGTGVAGGVTGDIKSTIYGGTSAYSTDMTAQNKLTQSYQNSLVTELNSMVGSTVKNFFSINSKYEIPGGLGLFSLDPQTGFLYTDLNDYQTLLDETHILASTTQDVLDFDGAGSAGQKHKDSINTQLRNIIIGIGSELSSEELMSGLTFDSASRTSVPYLLSTGLAKPYFWSNGFNTTSNVDTELQYQPPIVSYAKLNYKYSVGNAMDKQIDSLSKINLIDEILE